MAKNKLLRYQFTYNGKRYSVTGHSQKQLMDRVSEKKKVLQQASQISREMSVQSWKDEWLEIYKRPNVSPDTFESYRAILTHLDLVMPIKDVKPAHLQHLINGLRGKSNSLIHKFRVLLNDMFETAVDNGLCASNPAKKLVPPPGTTKKRRALTDYERKILLKTAETAPEGTYILLMLLCGLRPSEAGRVTGWDVDFKKRRLHVRGTKTASADRYVPIPDLLLPRLRDLGGDDFAVVDSYGNPTTKDSRRRMWDRFRKRMNLTAGCQTGRPHKHTPHDLPIGVMPIPDDLTAYCLRHTYATDLERAGVPINVARDLMGHSSVLITSKVYTHRTDEALDAAAEKLQALYSGPSFNKKSRAE